MTTQIETDYNDVTAGGELYAHRNHADSPVALHDRVVVWDAADEYRHPATVVDVNEDTGLIRLNVRWAENVQAVTDLSALLDGAYDTVFAGRWTALSANGALAVSHVLVMEPGHAARPIDGRVVDPWAHTGFIVDGRLSHTR